MAGNKKKIETKLIHSGEISPRIHGAVTLPIFQSSTFEYTGGTSYHDIKYIRLNNTPNHIALNQKLASLENAEAAMVTASGMAAISTAFFALLSPGDHFLVQDCLYGGTHSFITKDLKSMGYTFDTIDGNAPESWKKKIKKETKAVYVETITNPLLQVAELKAVSDFSRENGLISMIDNTFASPINFRPPELNFDLSIHSCTKYLNGHSDIVAGAVIGRKNLIEKVTFTLNRLGGTLDPHACFLLHRGLKTLAVRMKHQNNSAQQLAEFLMDHPQVEKVNYPGLISHPDHQRASQLLDGFSGMISFEIKGGGPAAERFIKKVSLPIIAPSLGGVETLMTQPATTSHAGISPQEREAMGVTDTLIRVSVGLEATEDLIADFNQALK
ncbi:trans-sulfuration enzyme family protein [bacterium]